MKFIFALFTFLFCHSLVAENFSSTFQDNDFCEFDLIRISQNSAPAVNCGPLQYLPFIHMTQWEKESYVSVKVSKNTPLNKGIYRVELSIPDSGDVHDGEEVSYQFSLMFPGPTVSDDLIFPELPPRSTAFVVAQWHAPNGESPPLAIRVLNSKVLAITMDLQSTSSRKTERITLWETPLTYDRKLDFKFDIIWSSMDKTGSLSVNLNGEAVVSYKGRIGQSAGQSGYYFKYGLYHSYPTLLNENFYFSILLGEYIQTQR